MNSGEEIFLTEEGAARMRSELEELKGPKRTALAARLRHAVSQGDLTENADYIMAKEDQAFLEGRIQELEFLLREATIIEKPAQGEAIQIGSTIVVAEDGRQPETYVLVGAKEANPRAGRISHQSPIGEALLGKRAGDTALAKTPGGEIRLKILEVR